MRTPKSVKRADAKRNRIMDHKSFQKTIGDIVIETQQITWGDNTTSRSICVYNKNAERMPWEPNYQPDLESYEFTTADEANKKYLELCTKYSK